MDSNPLVYANSPFAAYLHITPAHHLPTSIQTPTEPSPAFKYRLDATPHRTMDTKHNIDPRQHALHAEKHDQPQYVENVDHADIARADSGHTNKGPAGAGMYGEAQQHDPKWEKATVRKIDVRLLIICTYHPAACEMRGCNRDGTEGTRSLGGRTIRLEAGHADGTVGLCYAISLIDRTNISVCPCLEMRQSLSDERWTVYADIAQVARVAGMERSLRLDIGDRYSIISLLFFVPYIIFVSPHPTTRLVNGAPKTGRSTE